MFYFPQFQTRRRERKEKLIYFEGLAYAIMEASKSRICRVGQQAGKLQGRADAVVQFQRLTAGGIPQRKSVFLFYTGLQLIG